MLIGTSGAALSGRGLGSPNGVSSMTGYDVSCLAVLLLFGYAGFRRGLIGFVMQLAGSVVAFALAATLAPLFAPQAAAYLHLPPLVARPAAVVLLTTLFRFVFSFAIRELTAAVRAVAHSVGPLRVLDHVLGIAPGLALGALALIVVTLGLLAAPEGTPLHQRAEGSWLARSVLSQPTEALAALRGWWQALAAHPPTFDQSFLVAGTTGIWIATLAAWRLRGGRPRFAPVVPGEGNGSAGPRALVQGNVAAVPRFFAGITLVIVATALVLFVSRPHG